MARYDHGELQLLLPLHINFVFIDNWQVVEPLL